MTKTLDIPIHTDAEKNAVVEAIDFFNRRMVPLRIRPGDDLTYIVRVGCINELRLVCVDGFVDTNELFLFGKIVERVQHEIKDVA